MLEFERDRIDQNSGGFVADGEFGIQHSGGPQKWCALELSKAEVLNDGLTVIQSGIN